MLLVVNHFFLIILFIHSSSSDPLPDVSMTISLNKQPTYANKEIYGEFIFLNSSQVLKINFANINPDITFVILQLHVHNYRVELIQKSDTISTIEGSHLGFYSDVVYKKDIFYVTNINRGIHLSFYMAVHAYGLEDPVPGGCVLEETDVLVAPNITFFRDYMNVDIAPPMNPNDPQCNDPKQNVEFYMMYQPEFDFTRETYYDSIKRMMTLEGIRQNGINLVPRTYWPMRRMMSLYPAIGAVFVVVARSQSGYSIYVPNHTYGCDNKDQRCVWTGDWQAKVFCICLSIMSLCLCFLGHRYFKTEMVMVAFFTAFFVSDIIFSTIYNPDDVGILFMFTSVIIGSIFASVWLLSWWIFGIPVIAVLLSALNVGFLVAAIIYYRIPSDVYFLQSDFNFWALFILVVLLVTLGLVLVAHFGNLLSCAFLGSYGVVLSVDYYIGANLKFIMINVVRRATVPKFNKAVVMPPYQNSEKILTVLWVFFAIFGLVFQYWYNHGRPPFPPPPRARRNPTVYGNHNESMISRAAATPSPRLSERTPLLGPTSTTSYNA